MIQFPGGPDLAVHASRIRHAGPVPSALQRARPNPKGGVPVVTVPDPEEQDGRDAPRRDRPEDTDAAFTGIVADWRAEPDAPRWPADHDLAADADLAGRAEQDQEPEPPIPSLQRTPHGGDEDHFDPPEPPPFPVPSPRTMGGVAVLALGVLLLIYPSLLGVGDSMGTPLGLLAITAGIGWLVLGLRGGPPSEGWDDGARL